MDSHTAVMFSVFYVEPVFIYPYRQFAFSLANIYFFAPYALYSINTVNFLTEYRLGFVVCSGLDIYSWLICAWANAAICVVASDYFM